jgi:raffinose/stachyose/melibiose transport system substrate-binding protein
MTEMVHMTRKALAGLLLAATMITGACGGGGGDDTAGSDEAASPDDPAKVSGDLTVLTQRTDLEADGTLTRYAEEFKQTYPKVNVKFEAITAYEDEVKIRMNTENYGDVLLIPAAISKNDYPKFFAPLGPEADLKAKYLFTDRSAIDGTIYGLASLGTANGFVYNKAVWAKAGITEWPTAPAEFLDDLRAIDTKTDAVPYYTNYKDGWPLAAWSSVTGSVSCDPAANDKLASPDNPWAPGSDLNVGDTLLYDIVKSRLSEKDPTTTNWEGSKGQLATGKIATMWLGSWAISQLQDAAKKAGKNPADIGFMPFPTQVNGTFCSVINPDYLYGINIHSKQKPAARAWVDWMLEKSDFSDTQQAISAKQGAPLPPGLQPLKDNGVKFISLSQDKFGDVNDIDNASEVGISKPDYRQKLVDVARGSGKGDANSVFADLAKKWNTAAKDAAAGS